MIDILEVGADLVIGDSEVAKAKNIMSIQVGSLHYDPLIGIDLKYFLQENLRFQNESFQAHLIESLANFGVNVSTLLVENETLFSTYGFSVYSDDETTSLLAR